MCESVGGAVNKEKALLHAIFVCEADLVCIEFEYARKRIFKIKDTFTQYSLTSQVAFHPVLIESIFPEQMRMG